MQDISSFPSVVSILVTRTILIFPQKDLCMTKCSICYIAQSKKKNTQILGGPIVIFSSHPQDKPKNFAMKRKAEILILAGKKGNW